MQTSISEMKQSLITSGLSPDEVEKLGEQQLKARYKQVCAQLTSELSGEKTETVDDKQKILDKKAAGDYEVALKEHKAKIDKLIADGEYLTAIKEMFFNAPKNPNLVTGDAPNVAIGGAGFAKSLMKFLKNPKLALDLVKTAKNMLVKSFDELYNVVKSFLVQSKPSKALPQYVNITRKSGYSTKNVAEAFRFGNAPKSADSGKAGLEIMKYFMNRFGIKINPKDIKAVQVENNGAVEVLYTYFNPKTGKSMIFNQQGRLQSMVSYEYDKAGKIVDAVVEEVGTGVAEKVSSRLFNPRAAVHP